MTVARRSLLAATIVVSLQLLPLAAAESDVTPRPPGDPRLSANGPVFPLLGERFPIQVRASFSAALLHWLDSLAALRGPGLTAGKTVTAHRRQFERFHGPLDETDRARLRQYVDLRAELAASDRDGHRSETLTGCVFEASDLDEAIEHCSRMLAGRQQRRFQASMRHFAERYRPIWNDGLEVRGFLARVIADPRRDELAAFLVELSEFYGVAVPLRPTPRVILAPVPFGAGTHAQALGRFLLIEIRPGEGLIHEVPPIAHETAHFLFEALDEATERSLRQAAARHGQPGLAAWHLLHEALPTALAQGVAGERFQGDRWSTDDRWYHREAIDAYAKRIFPAVREAVRQRRGLDPALVDELVRAHPAVTTRPAPERSTDEITPRSP